MQTTSDAPPEATLGKVAGRSGELLAVLFAIEGFGKLSFIADTGGNRFSVVQYGAS